MLAVQPLVPATGQESNQPRSQAEDLPRFLRLPPVPFNGPNAERLGKILDSPNDELEATIKGLADDAFRAGHSTEGVELELQAAAASLANDHPTNADSILARLLQRNDLPIGVTVRIHIIRSLVAYYQQANDTSLAHLAEAHKQVLDNPTVSILVQHLQAQVLSSAGRTTETAEVLHKLDANQQGVAYPFAYIPKDDNWEIVSLFHRIALRKRYAVLWDERSSALRDAGVYFQFFDMFSKAREKPTSDEFKQAAERLADLAAFHGDYDTASFFLASYALFRGAADSAFANSPDEVELNLRLVAQDLQAGRIKDAQEQLQSITELVDSAFKDYDPKRWLLERFAIATATDVPDFPDISVTLFEELLNAAATMQQSPDADAETVKAARGIRYQAELRLARLYVRVPDYWKLRAVLNDLRQLAPQVAAARPDFDGTYAHRWFVDVEAAEAAQALRLPTAISQFRSIFDELESAIPLEDGRPADLPEVLRKLVEGSDERKAGYASNVYAIGIPLLSSFADELLASGDKARAYDLLQRAYYLLITEQMVCGSKEQPKLATKISNLALDLGLDDDAEGFLSSETSLCADAISRSDRLRAETLLAEGRYRARKHDIYHAEYALRRAQTILRKVGAGRSGLAAEVQLTLANLMLSEGRAAQAATDVNVVVDLLGRATETLPNLEERTLADRALTILAQSVLAGAQVDADILFQLLQMRTVSDAAVAFQNVTRRAAVADPGLRDNLKQLEETSYQLSLFDERIDEFFEKTEADTARAATRREQLYEQRSQLEARRRSLVGELGADPSLASVTAALQPTTLASLSDILGPDEALLEIKLVDGGVIELIVRPGTKPVMSITSTDTTELLADLISIRRTASPAPGSSDPPPFDLMAAFRTYSRLVAPVAPALTGVTNVYVVSDEAVQRVPFALLVRTPPPAGNGTDYRTVDFLVKESPTFSALPAANTLIDVRRALGPSTATRAAFVMAANPANRLEGNGDCDTVAPARSNNQISPRLRCRLLQLGPLGRAETLARELHDTEVGGLGPIQVVSPNGDDTEASFKAASLKDFHIVVLMAHSFPPSPDDGLDEPALVFRIPENATENDDGLLTASEAAQLSLDADLVMLMGCDTGGTRPGAEQILSGLGRAFLASGARSLLATQWEIRPDTIPLFTRGFFRALAAGARRSDAVRSASLQFLDPATVSLKAWSHPFFWASYTNFGEAAELGYRFR